MGSVVYLSRAPALRDARAVLHSPWRHDDATILAACEVLDDWGDAIDAMEANQMCRHITDGPAPQPKHRKTVALTFMLAGAVLSIVVLSTLPGFPRVHATPADRVIMMEMK